MVPQFGAIGDRQKKPVRGHYAKCLSRTNLPHKEPTQLGQRSTWWVWDNRTGNVDGSGKPAYLFRIERFTKGSGKYWLARVIGVNHDNTPKIEFPTLGCFKTLELAFARAKRLYADQLKAKAA